MKSIDIEFVGVEDMPLISYNRYYAAMLWPRPWGYTILLVHYGAVGYRQHLQLEVEVSLRGVRFMAIAVKL